MAIQLTAEDKLELARELRIEFSRSGGRARMARLTPEQRSELARKGGKARQQKAQ